MVDKFYSLNEIVVREKGLNTLKLDVYIDNYLLEKFAGDGILVATSFGTTAYNLSFGGSIVYNTFHSLELTTIANSIVFPQHKNITLVPNKTNNLIVTVDGINNVYDEVDKIETVIKDKTIKCLRNKDYNFIKKVNEKFII